MRQDMIGEAEGKRCLADARRSLDQDRMGALARPLRLREGGLGVIMAE